MDDLIRPLEKYATFTGRASRREYWTFTICYIILIGLLSAIGKQTAQIVSIIEIGLLIPSIAVGVRRMHDVDESGWMVIIPIVSLYFSLKDGTNGKNEYGPDPSKHHGKLSVWTIVLILLLLFGIPMILVPLLTIFNL